MNKYQLKYYKGHTLKLWLSLLFTGFLFLRPGGIVAQEQEEGPSRKYFFGGNLGLRFGTITDIEISPLAGYRITPRFSSGAGITYRYYREKFYNSQIFNTHIYGGRLFGSYSVIQNLNEFIGVPFNGGILAYSEIEHLNTDDYSWYNQTGENNRIWVTSVFIGGGIQQSLGRNSSVQILILWNLNETAYSLYSNPLIRFGFYF